MAVAHWSLVFRVSLVPLPVWASCALTIRFANILMLPLPAVRAEAAGRRLLSQTAVSHPAFTEGVLSALSSSHLTSKVEKLSPGQWKPRGYVGSKWCCWDLATGSSCPVEQTSKCQSAGLDSREPLDHLV